MYETHHPHQTPSGTLLILGETTWRRQYQRFGLFETDRLRHLYVLGKTGTGKSTLLGSLIAQDLAAGRGIAVLDPHGPLVSEALTRLDSSHPNRTLLFRPADKEFPVSFNVFRARQGLSTDFSLLASNLIAVFKKQWSAFWGPRLEHVLRNAILAVASDQRATLLFLYRFLTNEALRAKVVEKTTDPIVREFWLKEWPGYGARLQAEAVAPVLNKLGSFLSSATVRNIVGQERSRVDLRAIMDSGGVLFADLAVGELGEDASHLLGGLLLSSLHLCALGRPPGSRPFFIYADEFQHFVTDSLASMLSESRKFGLGLILAHQYLGQLPESLRQGVLGNTGSLALFRLGAEDAQLLEAEVEPQFLAHDLRELASYHFAARLLARGAQLSAFSARTIPPTPAPSEAGALAVSAASQSRLRYSVPRADVERFITAGSDL
jgi:hypothetical protein